MDPVLGAAVGKVAATATGQALGWSGKAATKIARGRGYKKLCKDFRSPSVASLADEVAKLSETELDAYLSYTESGEFRQIALQLSFLYLGRQLPEDEGLILQLKGTLKESLKLSRLSSSRHVDAIGDALFEDLRAAVLASVSNLARQMPTPVQESPVVVATVASRASAIARNSQLLQEIRNLVAIRNFENRLRGQVLNLHSMLRPPQAEGGRRVPFSRLFVEPRLLAREQKDMGGLDEIRLASLPTHGLRRVILGDPGGGKSTLSHKLALDIASDGAPAGLRIPFLIILREFSTDLNEQSVSIVDHIENLCRSRYQLRPPKNAIEYCLLNGQALIIFDGLDELLDTSLRRRVTEAVEAFAHLYPTAQILVTSRRVGYDQAPLDEDLFNIFELGEFDEPRVRDYVAKWFAVEADGSSEERTRLVNAFLAESAFVSDLRVNPLMLALMCAIYKGENYIPRNRPDVYEKCALMLFEAWDRSRGIRPELAFDHHIKAAMRSLALWLYSSSERQSGVTESSLVRYTTQYLLQKRFADEDEAASAAENFIDFCSGRAWVLTDVGTTAEGERLFAFTHRTFLEYFAASQLVRQNANAESLFEALRKHIDEEDWDVVSQLCVQILNRNVEDGADDFLELLLSSIVKASNEAQLRRLAFAARLFTFIVPKPAVVKATCSACLYQTALVTPKAREHRSTYSRSQPLGALLAPMAENRPLVSRYLLEALDEHDRNSSVWPAMLYILLNLQIFMILDNPTSSHSSLARWQAVSHEAGERFAQDIRRLAPTELWAAVSGFVAGAHTANELVDWHGIEGLFRSIEVAPVRWRGNPAAYRLFRRLITSSTDPSEIDVLEEAGHQVVQLLLERELPWVDVRMTDAGWHFEDPLPIEMSYVSRPRVYEYLVLMAAVITETQRLDIRGLISMLREMGDEWAISLMRARGLIRARGLKRDKTRIKQEPPSTLDPAVAQLLSKWGMGELDFLRGSRVTSMYK